MGEGRLVAARFIQNLMTDFNAELDVKDQASFGETALANVYEHLKNRANYAPTPMVKLNRLAKELGVAEILVKDEGMRFELGSFKALGGAYAVEVLARNAVAEKLKRDVTILDLYNDEDVKAVVKEIVFCCATDGNHGRSVAYGAQLIGAKAKVFVHEGVSQSRVAAMEEFGADVHRVAGNYDTSVLHAKTVADAEKWILVSDTSWEGYEDIPALVMQGYIAMVDEALAQIDLLPTHVFIQAGVGGVAAAVCAHLALRLGEDRPLIVIVEPDLAACVFQSALSGEASQIEAGAPTVMAMLECYKTSPLAWRIISKIADAFLTVDEEDAVSAMRRLANPVDGDASIIAGESGGVGLAGLMLICRDEEAMMQVGLEASSRILLINTEGATDPELYSQLIA